MKLGENFALKTEGALSMACTGGNCGKFERTDKGIVVSNTRLEKPPYGPAVLFRHDKWVATLAAAYYDNPRTLSDQIADELSLFPAEIEAVEVCAISGLLNNLEKLPPGESFTAYTNRYALVRHRFGQAVMKDAAVLAV